MVGLEFIPSVSFYFYIIIGENICFNIGQWMYSCAL